MDRKTSFRSFIYSHNLATANSVRIGLGEVVIGLTESLKKEINTKQRQNTSTTCAVRSPGGLERREKSLRTSWGGTSNETVLRSTFVYVSMQGRTKKIPAQNNMHMVKWRNGKAVRVAVSALLSLVGPAHQLINHLLHLNVMCFEQIKFNLIWIYGLDTFAVLWVWNAEISGDKGKMYRVIQIKFNQSV